MQADDAPAIKKKKKKKKKAQARGVSTRIMEAIYANADLSSVRRDVVDPPRSVADSSLDWLIGSQQSIGSAWMTLSFLSIRKTTRCRISHRSHGGTV